MSDKSPAFRFYAADFLADENVIAMDADALGGYILMLCAAWIEGSVRADLPYLARLTRIAPRRFEAIWPQIEPCWERREDGRLVNARLETEREKQREFADRQRTNGVRGGRPKKPTGNPTETQTQPVGFSGETQTKPKQKPAPTRFSLSLSGDTDTPSGVSAELTAPTMPSDLPERLPDDIDALKRVSVAFLAAFGNVTSQEAQARHGGAYTAALAMFRSRGATTAETWKAFSDAWLSRDGKPLFGDLAKTSIAFLPALSRRPAKAEPALSDAQREAAEAFDR